MNIEELQKIADLLSANITNSTKEVLTAEEAARYMGMSMSYVYKLTNRGLIPFYKPTGKMVYFKRTELEEWLLANRYATNTELEERAVDHMRQEGGRYGKR